MNIVFASGNRMLDLDDNIDSGGQINSIYAIIVEVGLGRLEVDNINDPTTFYVDNVAVGNGSSFTGAYEVMAGTSMATPFVTGCLAVIAKDEPASSTLTPEQLEFEARERAAKLLASVDYDDSLSKLCRTGGRVNLRGQSTFTKKAPLIAQAICEGGELKITGCFSGGSGELFIDDVDAETTNWSDNSISAFVGGLDNGTHGRTSCYHHATNPLAVSHDGYLYVTANNATEPSVMYFRSTDYNHADQQAKPTPAPDNQSQAGNGATSSKAGNAATSPKTGDSLPAAVLGAIVVLSLAGLAVANRLRRTTGRNQV